MELCPCLQNEVDEYMRKFFIARNQNLWATFLSLTI